MHTELWKVGHKLRFSHCRHSLQRDQVERGQATFAENSPRTLLQGPPAPMSEPPQNNLGSGCLKSQFHVNSQMRTSKHVLESHLRVSRGNSWSPRLRVKTRNMLQR